MAPARRRLAAGISSGMDALQGVLSALLQGRIVSQRQQEQNAATTGRTLLQDFQTQANGLSTPENVSKYGPDVVASQYNLLRRRLPAGMQGVIGPTPDFSTLDSAPASRLAPVGASIEGAKKPEDVLSDDAIRRQALERRVPGEVLNQDSVTTTPGIGGFPLVTGGNMQENPLLAGLLSEASKRRAQLEESEPGVATKHIGPDGTEVTDYMTPSQQRAAGTLQTGLSSAQNASREAASAGATKQAQTDVDNLPANISGAARRAGAVSGAQESATQSVDKRMGAGSFKPSTQAVEVTDENGNKSYQVIDTSPGSVGKVTAAGTTPTTQAERVASGYLRRGVTEHNEATRLEPTLMKRGTFANWANMAVYQRAPSLVTDPVMRQYLGAQQRYINAALGRPESGGAITEDEYKKYAVNFYQPGDDAKTLASRQNARREVLKGLATQSGPRLGVTVTAAEVARDAAEQGKSLQQALKEAADQNLLVVR